MCVSDESLESNSALAAVGICWALAQSCLGVAVSDESACACHSGCRPVESNGDVGGGVLSGVGDWGRGGGLFLVGVGVVGVVSCVVVAGAADGQRSAIPAVNAAASVLLIDGSVVLLQ